MNINKLFISFFVFFSSILGIAQENTFSAEISKTEVSVGERILIRFLFSTDQQSIQGFRKMRLPDFEGLKIIGKSEGTNIQILGRQMVKQYYQDVILIAEAEGEYKIGSATLELDDEKLKTQAFTVKVNTHSRRNSEPMASNRTRGAFIRADISNKHPYQNEEVLLTVKLYVRDYSMLNRSGNYKEPLFEGTVTRKVDNKNTNPVRHENIDGRTFISYELGKYVLLPKNSGELEINPFSIRVNLDGYYASEAIDLMTEPILINVKSLPPGKPKNFSGAVGDFNMIWVINKTELSTDETLNLEIEIIGSGNLNTLKMPKIKFPSTFEIYSPKKRDAYYVRDNGIQGKKTEEYIFVPQYGGDYTIEPIQFCYFNPKEEKYKTILSDSIKLKVAGPPPPVIAKSSGQKTDNSQSSEPLIIDPDFGNNEEAESASIWPNSSDKISELGRVINESTRKDWIWWLTGISGTSLFLGFFLFDRKKRLDEEAVTKKQFVKNIKDELSELKQLSKSDDPSKFYEKQETILTEIALYLCNLNIAEFSAEKFIEELKDKYDVELLNGWKKLFSSCRQSKYANITTSSDLNQQYHNTEAITLQFLST